VDGGTDIKMSATYDNRFVEKALQSTGQLAAIAFKALCIRALNHTLNNELDAFGRHLRKVGTNGDMARL
jgi:hypothetical protein